MERLIPRNERLAIVRHRTGALLSRAAVRLLPLPRRDLIPPHSPPLSGFPLKMERIYPRIASALLMSPAAMGERLVRAKERIRHHRLALMFACAHPAVEAGIRAPLILQVVLGLNAKRIASALDPNQVSTSRPLKNP